MLELERNRNSKNRNRSRRPAYLAAAGLLFSSGDNHNPADTTQPITDTPTEPKNNSGDRLQFIRKLARDTIQEKNKQDRQAADNEDFLKTVDESIREDEKSILSKLRNNLVLFDSPGTEDSVKKNNFSGGFSYEIPMFGDFIIKEQWPETDDGYIKIDEPSTWVVSFEPQIGRGFDIKDPLNNKKEFKSIDAVIDYFDEVNSDLEYFKNNLNEQRKIMHEMLGYDKNNPTEAELQNQARGDYTEAVEAGNDILKDVKEVLELK